MMAVSESQKCETHMLIRPLAGPAAMGSMETGMWYDMPAIASTLLPYPCRLKFIVP